MAGQSPSKVNQQTKERVRYFAALTRPTSWIEPSRGTPVATQISCSGESSGRFVLAAGDVAEAARLLNMPVEAVTRVAGTTLPPVVG